MDNRKTAQKFWQSQNTYPNYENIKKRRLVELNFLVPQIEAEGIISMLDLGCGDGALIKCLHELTDIEIFYGFDFSPMRMDYKIPAIIDHYDCNYPEPLPKVDLLVFSGVMPFIFDEKTVHDNLKRFDAKYIYIKMPCSMEKDDILINTYSEQLKMNYSSIYRTKENVLNILAQHFFVQTYFPMYPDELESKFGTKQIAFICRKK